MILRELVAKFGFAVDQSGIDKIDAAITRSKKGLGQVAERAQGVGKTLSTFVTLPILGIGAAAIKAASDSEEAFAKFGTVFQDVSDQADQSAKNLAKNFGLSSTAARELLGDTGDLLTGFGFTGKMALDLSTKVNELAVDLASFTNFQGGAKGASEALTKALLGERESVKSLGISILDADVKAQVLKNSQMGLTFETERQAKAYATLQLAQQQSKNAIGDYARTQDGAANRTRKFRQRINDLAVSFGKILIPIYNRVIARLTKLVEFFTSLSDRSKRLILIIAGIAAVMGPLILIISTVVLGVVSMIGAFTGLAASLGLTNAMLLLMIGKFILIGAVFAAIIAIVVLVIEDFIAWLNGEDSVFGLIGDFLTKGIDGAIGWMLEKFVEMETAIIEWFSSMVSKAAEFGSKFAEAIAEGFSDLKEKFMNFNIGDVAANLTGGIGGLFGFGPSENNGGGNTTQTANVNAPIEINVPAGTPPEEVASVAQESLNESLTSLFQDTSKQISSPIAE